MRFCFASTFGLLLSLASLEHAQAEPLFSAKTAPDQELTETGKNTASAHAHFLLARQLEDSDRLREALEHYIALLKAGVTDPPLIAHIADLVASYQGADVAAQLLEDSLKANPQKSDAYLNLSHFALGHAERNPALMQRATVVATDALVKFPQRADVYENAARLQLAQGQRDQAAKILETAAKQDVSTAQYWLKIARLAQEVWPLADSENRPQQLAKINVFIEKALQKARAAKDEDAEILVADFYLFSVQLDKSLEICDALGKNYGSLNARKRLVRMYDAIEKPDEALSALESLVQAYPNDVEHRQLLANEYVQKREVNKAITQLEAALQAGGGDLNEYLQISNLLRFTDQSEKFENFTARAQQLFPEEPRLGFYRGLALNGLKKHREAAELFRKTAAQAETMAPELLDDTYYFSWGVALERSGNYDDAARQFDKSIQLTSPDDISRAANTMNYLGYMWLDRNQNMDKAEQFIRKANELEQNNPAFIDSMGWLYFKQGKHSEALTEFLKAESLMKEFTSADAEILDHIAQTYDKLGKIDKAKEYWQRTLDLQPEIEDIRNRARKALGLEKPVTPENEVAEPKPAVP